MTNGGTISNSYIYKYVGIIKELKDDITSNLNCKRIIVKLSGKYYLFITDTSDFSFTEINEIYKKEQIYINLRGNKVSHDFFNDYRKLKKNGNYFEVNKNNLFIESELKIKNILNREFIGNCLDVGCGDSIYKNFFTKFNVNYLGVDIHKVNNGLNILETTFEDFESNNKFDIIFFFRSINHFSNTRNIINKAYGLLNNKGKIFIVENESFGEIKFKNQIFEGKKSDFEHFFNYTLLEFKKLVNSNKFNIIEEDSVTINKANQWYILLEKNENISN